MDKVKRNAVTFLFESEGIIVPKMISHIRDVDIDKNSDFIRIDFSTTDNVSRSLVAKYRRFKDWYARNISKKTNSVFMDFLKDFIKHSKPQKTEPNNEGEVNEIVDAEGNLYDDSSVPNNSRG